MIEFQSAQIFMKGMTHEYSAITAQIQKRCLSMTQSPCDSWELLLSDTVDVSARVGGWEARRD